jgi:ADP-heptose:LPS heptosyltransferase
MIIIAPFAQKLRSGKTNPKNYAYWKELIPLISEEVVQVGIDGEEQLVSNFQKNLSISQLKELIGECRTWIGVDSMFQHLAWSCNKPGIVLWTVSNPNIFGHPENTNLLKSKDNLAKNQFLWWDSTEYDPDKSINPEIVLQFLVKFTQA